jgi:hypothetical protein
LVLEQHPRRDTLRPSDGAGQARVGAVRGVRFSVTLIVPSFAAHQLRCTRRDHKSCGPRPSPDFGIARTGWRRSYSDFPNAPGRLVARTSRPLGSGS